MNIASSSGNPVTTSTGSVINGILLGPDKNFTLQGRSGPVLGGELAEISLISDAEVRVEPFPVFPEPRDLGGDGKADVVLRQASTGQLYLFEMDGNAYTPSNIGALDPVWELVAIADLGGDNKGDLLLRHTDTGQLYLWEMDGNVKTPSNIGALNPAWDVAGTGDFGGDGRADILLRHSDTGQLYLWEMDGNIVTRSNIGALSLVWKVAGIGDFGGDGKDDILLRHISTGQLYLFEMDGNVKTPSNIGALNPVWEVVAVRDLAGDGKADILLRHRATGQLYLFEMDGNLKSPSNIGMVSLVWDIVQVSDFGGDGKADILFRHGATGQLYLWEMDGNSAALSNVGIVNPVWVIQPAVSAVTAPVDAVDDNPTDFLSLTAKVIAVLGNDSGSAPLSVLPGSLSDPANGEVTLNPDNTITYVQDGKAKENDGLVYYYNNCRGCHSVDGFSGKDAFTYTASDGYSSDTATVTVTVTSFDLAGSASDLSGYTPALTACGDLPHTCYGLTDVQIQAIGRFLGEVFP
jgi:hypothetical protein